MSKQFTQKERDLHDLMWQADTLATELLQATRNVQGYHDTQHPLSNTVRALASRIDEMLERMQLCN